jgi:hypothetical protein
MPVYDTTKPLTDEQWDAYTAERNKEVITESQILTRQFGVNQWTPSLVKKYLRPVSLGPGPTEWGRAKNRYTRGAVAAAWCTVPEHIREEREAMVQGW